MAANPMTQFNVYRIGPEVKVGVFDISFTNASLFMIIRLFAICDSGPNRADMAINYGRPWDKDDPQRFARYDRSECGGSLW